MYVYICNNFNNKSAQCRNSEYSEFHVTPTTVFSRLIITLYRKGTIL